VNSLDVELSVAHYFGIRSNIIIPNISWGMNIHECDLLILTSSNYAYEVEIKVSKSDLKKDTEKNHKHNSDKIKRLYFAVPEKLINEESIPDHAGILSINESKYGALIAKLYRKPKERKVSPWSYMERYALLRLGCMRIWGLKAKIKREKNDS